jgi:hypothetical protein
LDLSEAVGVYDGARSVGATGPLSYVWFCSKETKEKFGNEEWYKEDANSCKINI